MTCIFLIGILTAVISPAENPSGSEQALPLRSSANDHDFIKNALPYARLSDAAYGKSAAPATYTEIDRLKGDMGLEAATFRGQSEIVVAFAGTDPTKPSDYVTNAHALLPSATPSQFKQAINYVSKLKSDNPETKITLTGHSLGGQIALFVGGTSDLDAIAFNAPPPNLKMRAEISAVQAKNIDYASKPIALNFTSREGYQSHTGLTADAVSDADVGMRWDYGRVIPVPVQGQGTIGASTIQKPIRYIESFLSYHYIKELTESMESLSKEGGREEYNNVTKIWDDIDSRSTTSQTIPVPGVDIEKGTTTGGGSPPMELPGIDFEKGTTTGGGSPPMELPGIDFENGTTTGGGGPPIPLPQIPPLPE